MRRIKQKEYSKIWRDKNVNKSRQVGRDNFKRNSGKWKRRSKEELASYMRDYRANNYEKNAARWAVKGALRTGKLIKPPQCENCNLDKKLEAHHFMGYAPEFRLTVVWLCHNCHNQEEIRLRSDLPSP